MSKSSNSSNYLNTLTDLLENIKYGTITLVIQDGVVIQIETTEKIRLK
ncbi:YezD family protein [Clostridium sp. 19966]|nr:YezD family protein [Clostridium sp. 19966]